jgi:hypothetical protein
MKKKSATASSINEEGVEEEEGHVSAIARAAGWFLDCWEVVALSFG